MIPTWLRLTRPQGDPVFVNGDFVMFVRAERGERGAPLSKLEFPDDRYVTVLETPENIAQRLGATVG